MATFRIVLIFILEAIVVAAVVKRWCSWTARREGQRGKEKELPILDYRTDVKIIDGGVYVEFRGLISNLKTIYEAVEKFQSGPKSS